MLMQSSYNASQHVNKICQLALQYSHIIMDPIVFIGKTLIFLPNP